MQDKHKYKKLGVIYESMVSRREGGSEEGDQAMSDQASTPPTKTELVYGLIRDLAAENPGKDPAGYLKVFATYSAFVKRAKDLIDRIDNWTQR